MTTDRWVPPSVLLAVDLVILTVRASCLQVLVIERGVDPHRGALALPGGFLNHQQEDLVTAAQRELHEEAGLGPDGLHLEHLGAYGAPDRDPRARVISAAYLAIAPRLPAPVAGSDAANAWWIPVATALSGARPLAFDHEQILADGVDRAREKLERTALASAFCGPTFTISDLQDIYEAVWGMSLDPRNFYRKVQSVEGFIIPVGLSRTTERGRPARLFRTGPRTTLYPPIIRPQGQKGRQPS
ncbi:MAG: NUDIX hydrolase [Dermatophilaceae bacterium]